MNLEFSKALDRGQTGYRLSTNKTSRATSFSLLSLLHCAFIRLRCPVHQTSDAVMLLSGQSLPTLESQGHFADPSTAQVPAAAMASLTLVLSIQMGLPLAPLYPTHPTCCALGGNPSLTVKVSGGSGHWPFSSALSKCTVKPRTILVRPCYSSYYLVPWAEVAC